MEDANTQPTPFDIEFLVNIMQGLPRQGPGSRESTLKALSAIKIPPAARVLDLGCGTGAQSRVLAENFTGTLIAVDFFIQFLKKIRTSELSLKAQSGLIALCADMKTLPFSDETFDIIWSEGAIYNIGFVQGLQTFKKYLKSDGYFAFSEVVWLKQNPPQEVVEFWQHEYPAIGSIDDAFVIIRDTGFILIDHFTLPANDWLENYYAPLLEQIEYLKLHYAEYPSKMQLLNDLVKEAKMYHKYHEFYGYEFYILQKR